jgi:hypothetical protein
MSEKFHETHKYSKRFAVIKFISASIFGLILIVLTFMPLKNFVAGLELPIPVLATDLAIIIIVLVIATILHALFINRIYDTLSTYSYFHNELQTKISYSEAAYLKQLFEPEYVHSDHWVSMTNITTIPENMRRKVAMETGKKLLEGAKL